MIQKTGMNDISFKAVYLYETKDTKHVLQEGRLFNIKGKQTPFPKKDFDEKVRMLTECTDQYECDIVINFNDHGDTFTTHFELYDRNHTDDGSFDCYDDDTCKEAEKRLTPFSNMFYEAFFRLRQYFRLTTWKEPKTP